jgi:hypothetical protein
VTQTYMIAHQARGKLAKEANCPDHNLHRLVCHSNMLDTLIFDLAHAEEEQENYLNKLTSGEHKPAKKSKVEKWAHIVMEKLEEESESGDERDLSSDEDSSDEEFEHWENIASDKTNGIVIISSGVQECANELQEEHAKLALGRTKTHHHRSSSKHTKSASKSR